MTRSKFLSAFHFLTNHPAYRQAPFRSWYRVVNWYLRVALGLAPVRSLPSWNLSVKLPSVYRTPAKVFYVFDKDYDENLLLLTDFIKEGGVFVDAGANFGIYSLLAARLVGERGAAFAFEPIPSLCKLLRANAERNHLVALKVVETALGEQVGTASLAIHEDSGRSTLVGLQEGVIDSIQVRTSTLDAEINADLVVSLLKLDVEGFEVAVLKGATRILQNDRPVILFEYNPDALAKVNSSPDILLRILKDAGYDLYEVTETGTLVQAVPTNFGNFVAIHSLDARLSKTIQRPGPAR